MSTVSEELSFEGSLWWNGAYRPKSRWDALAHYPLLFTDALAGPAVCRLTDKGVWFNARRVSGLYDTLYLLLTPTLALAIASLLPLASRGLVVAAALPIVSWCLYQFVVWAARREVGLTKPASVYVEWEEVARVADRRAGSVQIDLFVPSGEVLWNTSARPLIHRVGNIHFRSKTPRALTEAVNERLARRGRPNARKRPWLAWALLVVSWAGLILLVHWQSKHGG
jgi:hypothetical protein